MTSNTFKTDLSDELELETQKTLDCTHALPEQANFKCAFLREKRVYIKNTLLNGPFFRCMLF